jgi:hypothetical protein
MKNSNSAKGF